MWANTLELTPYQYPPSTKNSLRDYAFINVVNYLEIIYKSHKARAESLERDFILWAKAQDLRFWLQQNNYDNSAVFPGKKKVTFLEYHRYYNIGESLQGGLWTILTVILFTKSFSEHLQISQACFKKICQIAIFLLEFHFIISTSNTEVQGKLSLWEPYWTH